MIEIRKDEPVANRGSADEKGIDLREIFLVLQSGKKTILWTTALLVVLTTSFCLLTTSYYSGTVNFLIDQRRLQVFGLNQNNQDNSVLSDAAIDNNTVDTLASTISSSTVLARVVKKLELTSDPEFNGSNSNIIQDVISRVRGYFSPGTPRTDEQKLRGIVSLMQKRLKVQRLGTSYMIELTYDATSPTKAAKIANAIADAFLEDQLSASTETLQRASSWLDDRLKELQGKAATADLAVLRFRQDNQLELSTRSRELQVQLKYLESTAQSYRVIYDTLLQRHNFAVEQQSLPSTAARIVTPAVAPTEKSFPKTLIFIGISAVLGMALGAFICIVRSIFDSSVRTRAALAEATGVSCVAVIPRNGAGPGSRGSGLRRSSRFRGDRRPTVASTIHPETLERVKLLLSVRVARPSKVVSFASCSPGEGKTSCSIAFARLVSRRGGKVIFIDGDLLNPQATRSVFPGTSDFSDEGQALFRRPQMVDLDGDTFAFLPLSDVSTAVERELPPPALPDLTHVIAEARNHYDYIVIDLAPLSLSTDVSALEPSIDAIFLVTEWGKTNTETLSLCLASSKSVLQKMYGAILNKVDLAWLARAERDPTVLLHYSYGRHRSVPSQLPRKPSASQPIAS